MTDHLPTWDDLTTELDDLRASLVGIVASWLPILDQPGEHDHLAGMVAAYRLTIHTLTARIAAIRTALADGDPVPRFGAETGPRQLGLFDELDVMTWATVRTSERTIATRTAARRLAQAVTRDRTP